MQVATLVAREFFEQGDIEKEELNLKPQVRYLFTISRPGLHFAKNVATARLWTWIYEESFTTLEIKSFYVKLM